MDEKDTGYAGGGPGAGTLKDLLAKIKNEPWLLKDTPFAPHGSVAGKGSCGPNIQSIPKPKKWAGMDIASDGSLSAGTMFMVMPDGEKHLLGQTTNLKLEVVKPHVPKLDKAVFHYDAESSSSISEAFKAMGLAAKGAAKAMHMPVQAALVNGAKVRLFGVAPGVDKKPQKTNWTFRRINKWAELSKAIMDAMIPSPKENEGYVFRVWGFDDSESNMTELTVYSWGRLLIDGYLAVEGCRPYDYAHPERDGAKWDHEEEQFLITNYEAGDDPATLARKHQRTINAVLSRLEMRKYLTRKGVKTNYYQKPNFNTGELTKYYRPDGSLFADLVQLKKQYH